jgi:hypothetical protein
MDMSSVTCTKPGSRQVDAGEQMYVVEKYALMGRQSSVEDERRCRRLLVLPSLSLHESRTCLVCAAVRPV